MRRILPLLALLLACAAAHGQSVARYEPTEGVPPVFFNDRMAELQTSLYPTIYQTQDATPDMAWLQSHDGELLAFWQEHGASLLQALMTYSGLTWREPKLDVTLLRYYPSVGSYDPILLPVDGVRTGPMAEAIPPGAVLQLILMYQLAERILMQTTDSAGIYSSVTAHPLWQPGPLTRDNLAMLVALAAGRVVLGPDSIDYAWNSTFWRKHFPGRELLEKYLLDSWKLNAEKPLIKWVLSEPYNSDLVQAATQGGQVAEQQLQARQSAPIEGIPPGGQLGFSVRVNERGQLIVDNVDSARAAFRAGLRPGDVINRVGGQRPRTQRELIEMILGQIDYGAIVQITRAGKADVVTIRPLPKKRN